MTEPEVKLISLAPVASVPKMGNPIDPIPDKDILQWGERSQSYRLSDFSESRCS